MSVCRYWPDWTTATHYWVKLRLTPSWRCSVYRAMEPGLFFKHPGIAVAFWAAPAASSSQSRLQVGCDDWWPTTSAAPQHQHTSLSRVSLDGLYARLMFRYVSHAWSVHSDAVRRLSGTHYHYLGCLELAAYISYHYSDSLLVFKSSQKT